MGTAAGIRQVRVFLAVQAAAFASAALLHAGAWMSGYEHREARTAESVIALVLLGGLLGSLARPSWTRRAGLASQWFALLGTCVGLFTIAIGVGPRTALDLVVHAAFIALLIVGLRRTARISGSRS